MEDADVLEGIYRKFCEKGDISYRESDIVFRIAQRFFSRKSYLSLKDVVPKWYEKVKSKILNGGRGVFMHTVPLGSAEDFYRNLGTTGDPANLACCLTEINDIFREMKRPVCINLVILRDKDQLCTLGDGIPKTLLIKRFDKVNNKNAYRFLRADTLRRLGNFVYIDLDGIKTREFDIACAYRYEMKEKNCAVDRLAQVYAAVFLELENAGIKFLTCSNRAGYAYGYFDELGVFADEKDAERIEGVLKTSDCIAESLKGAVREFSVRDLYLFSPAKDCELSMNDPYFRKLVKSHVSQFFPEKRKDAVEEEEWLDITR
jgi:hypothetical protein